MNYQFQTLNHEILEIIFDSKDPSNPLIFPKDLTKLLAKIQIRKYIKPQ